MVASIVDQGLGKSAAMPVGLKMVGEGGATGRQQQRGIVYGNAHVPEILTEREGEDVDRDVAAGELAAHLAREERGVRAGDDYTGSTQSRMVTPSNSRRPRSGVRMVRLRISPSGSNLPNSMKPRGRGSGVSAHLHS